MSELVNLRLVDVDFESREITVRQGKGRKDRVVPLVGQALEALKAYLAVREVSPEYDNVFLARNRTSMDQRTVRYRIQKYYKEAGIRKKASVHTLRHTFATHQIHNGLKINQLKDVLGHKKMETTYKYVGPSIPAHITRNVMNTSDDDQKTTSSDTPLQKQSESEEAKDAIINVLRDAGVQDAIYIVQSINDFLRNVGPEASRKRQQQYVEPFKCDDSDVEDFDNTVKQVLIDVSVASQKSFSTATLVCAIIA